MTEGDRYTADPQRLDAHTRQIAKISSLANSLGDDFISRVTATAGWTGLHDDLAKDLVPRDMKERQQTASTADALTTAILSIVRGTEANLKSIVQNQQGNLDAIHDAAALATESGGSSGGKKR
ncbi:hypothetical protein ACIRH0_42035 [Streptomyces sp. NPDC093675]|uniref:hypothetical protein n=1 Tax=Streptomyces sp. NPDC093675 TaxID=3366049 RepID=UPI0037F4F4F0